MAGNACLPAKWMCTVLSVDTNPPGTAFQVPFQATFSVPRQNPGCIEHAEEVQGTDHVFPVVRSRTKTFSVKKKKNFR